MAHYIAFIYPMASGGWGGRVPDLPNCSVEARSLDSALGELMHQAQELAAQLMGNDIRLPQPRTLEALIADQGWVNGVPIEFSKAITLVIRVPG